MFISSGKAFRERTFEARVTSDNQGMRFVDVIHITIFSRFDKDSLKRGLVNIHSVFETQHFQIIAIWAGKRFHGNPFA